MRRLLGATLAAAIVGDDAGNSAVDLELRGDASSGGPEGEDLALFAGCIR